MIAERALWRLRSGRLRRLGHRSSTTSSSPSTRSFSAGARGRRRRRRGRIPPRVRLGIAVLIVLLGFLGGAWLWVRDSSLVSVRQVSVTGTGGPDAVQIRAVLTSAARQMTTLDVNLHKLRTAVSAYPVVGDLKVSPQFPHKLRIRVIERVPVGTVSVGGRAMPVSGDGTLLQDVTPGATLPAIVTPGAPVGARLSDPSALRAVALLAAAPARFIARLTQVTTGPPHGLTAQLRNGPTLYFGDASQLSAKWIAVTQVLGDAGSAGAAYIDVTDPGRPAAGSGNDQAAAATGSPTTPAGG
jgi:cell division protein FtsQ